MKGGKMFVECINYTSNTGYNNYNNRLDDYGALSTLNSSEEPNAIDIYSIYAAFD
jgi:hypothetical protein